MNAAPRRLPRWCRALLALAAGCVVAGIASELLLRWLLFGSGDLAQRFGRPFRVSAYWAPDVDQEDAYKLQTLFEADRARPVAGKHPVLGWIADVDPVTWAHRDESTIAGRRPVLLFGDSFAQCVTDYVDCWQGLLERSTASSRLALLNYGIGGYGLDQVSMLAERVVPRFADKNPIVVVAILVDDDLERCFLRFRGDPKPIFRLVDGELVLEEPGDQHRLEWVADHPPEIPSYVARLLDKARGGFVEQRRVIGAEEEAQRTALVDAILARIRSNLAANGIRDWFVLLFHGERALLYDPSTRWPEETVAAFCRRNDVRLVSSRPYLDAAIAAGVPMSGLFVDPASTARGHYGIAGNIVVMEALMQGLRGKPAADVSTVHDLVRAGVIEADLEYHERFSIRGRAGLIRASSGPDCIRMRRTPDGSERLALRAGDLGLTDVRVVLSGEGCLTASVRAVANPSSTSPPEPPIVLSWLGPDGRWKSRSFAVGEPETRLTILDLDASALELRVERPGGDPRGVWLLLDDPMFRCDGAR